MILLRHLVCEGVHDVPRYLSVVEDEAADSGESLGAVWLQHCLT